MKKLYTWIVAILLPVIVYMVIFFCNDPYNYFGNQEALQDFSLISKMVEFKNNDYNGLILGDSRIEKYDVTNISNSSGLNYLNMAFGGCVPTEVVSLFYWCYENSKVPLKKVIISTGFYHFNSLMQEDRIDQVNTVIKSPLSYCFSFDNAKSMTEKIKEKKHPKEVKQIDLSDPNRIVKNRVHTEMYLEKFSYDEDVIQSFIELGKFCKINNIELVIVSPPWHRNFWNTVSNYECSKIVDDWKVEISPFIPIYDMEYPNCPLNDYTECFSDTTHSYGFVFNSFCNEFETGIPIFSKLWKDGVVVN